MAHLILEIYSFFILFFSSLLVLHVIFWHWLHVLSTFIASWLSIFFSWLYAFNMTVDNSSLIERSRFKRVLKEPFLSDMGCKVITIIFYLIICYVTLLFCYTGVGPLVPTFEVWATEESRVDRCQITTCVCSITESSKNHNVDIHYGGPSVLFIETVLG